MSLLHLSSWYLYWLPRLVMDSCGLSMQLCLVPVIVVLYEFALRNLFSAIYVGLLKSINVDMAKQDP